MSADPRRSALDARVLAWMRDNAAWQEPRELQDKRFQELALELFAFQYAHCEPYRRFCQHRRETPREVSSWQEIPAVPTGAFKEVSLRSFPAEQTLCTFRTSGTSLGARGTLHLDTLEIYHASLLPSFRRHIFPDFDTTQLPVRIRVLAPRPAEAPDSSLSHMFQVVLDALADSSAGFDVEAGTLRVESVLAAIEASVATRQPLALCGTAFAFVHLLDALQQRGLCFQLPAGSRIMETGGFKGRSRELSRQELYAEIEAALGIPAAAIVNQYGMTELGSQFYDSNLRFPSEARRKLGPPWARVRIVDPETGHDVEPGEVGTLVVVDLANTGSVLAVQTADLGRCIDDGFELLGREPGAEQRGCSIAADAMLGGDGR